ncbi:MAG: YdcF family protein [Clostridiaceae bacterium]|nr:YdcF family protein [Clostridiaceae bacterium]
MRFFLRLILILTGVCLLLNSLLVVTRVNFSLAVVLPAIIGLPLLLWGLFYRPLQHLTRRGFWLGVKVALIAGYGILLLSGGFVAGLMVRQLQEKPTADCQAIIVPGAGLRGDLVSALLAARLDTALDYWRARPELLIVVCGGQGPDETVPEAQAMARYLEERGVPAAQILLDDQSVSTRENLVNARSLLLTRGSGKDETRLPVCIATSDYHVYRTVCQANTLGFKASGLGAPTLWYLLPGDFLREYLAVARYHILGY